MNDAFVDKWTLSMPRASFEALAIAASATMYYLGTGLNPLWPLAWFAPLPVLYVAFRRKWWIAALCALLAFTLGRMNLFDYAKEIAGGSYSGAVLVMIVGALIPAIAFTTVVLIARYAVHKLPNWIAMFAFPFALTTYEFLASTSVISGSLFSITYSQTDFLPLIQVASVFGIFGITFLVSLFPSAIAIPWCDRPVTVLAPAGILIAAALIYGGVRLQANAGGESLRVALIASDAAYKSSLTQTREEALAIIDVYAQPVRELALQGAQLAVLPEKIVGFAPADKELIVKAMSDLARATHTTLLVGASENGKPRRNIALVFGPDGALLAEYAKHHLVPGIENGYASGMTPEFFDIASTPVGVAICKDNDFPPWLRQYGKQDARILAVPALDFDIDDRLHARVAVMRGVENGASLARVAGRGRLTLSDENGRVLFEKSTAEAPLVTLIGELPKGTGTTLYNRFGDWFAWLSALATVTLLIVSRLVRKKPSS